MGQVVSLQEWKAAKPKATETSFHFGAVVITFKLPQVETHTISTYDAAVAWRRLFWGF